MVDHWLTIGLCGHRGTLLACGTPHVRRWGEALIILLPPLDPHSQRTSCCWIRTCPTLASNSSTSGSPTRLKLGMSSRTYSGPRSSWVRHSFVGGGVLWAQKCWPHPAEVPLGGLSPCGAGGRAGCPMCVHTQQMDAFVGMDICIFPPKMILFSPLFPPKAPEIVNYEPLGLEADMW